MIYIEFHFTFTLSFMFSQGNPEWHRCDRWKRQQAGSIYGQRSRKEKWHNSLTLLSINDLNSRCIPPVESSRKRHHSGGRLSDHHGCSRNEYVNLYRVSSSRYPLLPLDVSFFFPLFRQSSSLSSCRGWKNTSSCRSDFSLHLPSPNMKVSICSSSFVLCFHRESRFSTDPFKWCWWEGCK